MIDQWIVALLRHQLHLYLFLFFTVIKNTHVHELLDVDEPVGFFVLQGLVNALLAQILSENVLDWVLVFSFFGRLTIPHFLQHKRQDPAVLAALNALFANEKSDQWLVAAASAE